MEQWTMDHGTVRNSLSQWSNGPRTVVPCGVVWANGAMDYGKGCEYNPTTPNTDQNSFLSQLSPQPSRQHVRLQWYMYDSLTPFPFEHFFLAHGFESQEVTFNQISSPIAPLAQNIPHGPPREPTLHSIVVRASAQGAGGRGSIPDRVTPKT